METTMLPLQAGWNTVLVDSGELCVTTGGVLLMFLLCVNNLD